MQYKHVQNSSTAAAESKYSIPTEAAVIYCNSIVSINALTTNVSTWCKMIICPLLSTCLGPDTSLAHSAHARVPCQLTHDLYSHASNMHLSLNLHA